MFIMQCDYTKNITPAELEESLATPGTGPTTEQCRDDTDCKEGMKCEEGSCSRAGAPFQCQSDADCSECNQCVARTASMGWVFLSLNFGFVLTCFVNY